MKSSLRTVVGVGMLLVVGFVAASALATPVPDSAVMNLRLWNDDPDSILTDGNLYPSSIYIQDNKLDGDGLGGEYANRHNFRLSANGGISQMNLANGDAFAFFSDVKISGTGNGEGGLSLSPWWSQNHDGIFMLNSASGEIAVFGGRLPFYSFTGAYGLHYVKGETVREGFVYNPHSLSAADPATVQYCLIKGGTWYSSGPIPFDEGNPAELHGSWGMLDGAQVGGLFQPYIVVGDPTNGVRIDFNNMSFVPEPATLALLGIVAAFALRRGR
jgi:hypothetical protein